jgi:hypothetical protein
MSIASLVRKGAYTGVARHKLDGVMILGEPT